MQIELDEKTAAALQLRADKFASSLETSAADLIRDGLIECGFLPLPDEWADEEAPV